MEYGGRAGGGGVRSRPRYLKLSFGRSIGRPGARERRTAERASALTDARVTTTPKGLNLGAGLVPGG